MSVDWIAVAVTIVAAGIAAAFTSGFRRLADQISAGDQRLADRIAVVTQKVAYLADLVERQRGVRPATKPPADDEAGHSMTATTTTGRDQASIGALVAGIALTPGPVAVTNPARAYLAGLAESGRRGMTTALSQAADVLTQGAGSIDTTPWQRLTPDHVMAIKRQMIDNDAAPATINRMVSALRGVARSAWRAGLISADQQARIADVPLSKVRRIPAGRHVAVDEIAALFGVCDLDTPAGARDAAMLALLYGAGLRRSELVSLDLGDYDAAGGAIAVTGKGGHQRHVYATNGGTAILGERVSGLGVRRLTVATRPRWRRAGTLAGRASRQTAGLHDQPRRRAVVGAVARTPDPAGEVRRAVVGRAVAAGGMQATGAGTTETDTGAAAAVASSCVPAPGPRR